MCSESTGPSRRCLDEFKEWRCQPYQLGFQLVASLIGTLLYSGLYCGVTAGVVWLTGLATVLLTIGVFATLIQAEADLETGKVRSIYHRGQSYLFMVGPILLSILLMLAAHVWREHWNELPMERSWLWFWGGFVLIGASGVVFRLVDNGRYADPQWNAASMLKSPSKWWLDHWQMPVSISSVLVTVVPTWWISSPERPWMIGLTTVCVMLAILDGLRDLNPNDQHVRWDTVRFRPAGEG